MDILKYPVIIEVILWIACSCIAAAIHYALKLTKGKLGEGISLGFWSSAMHLYTEFLFSAVLGRQPQPPSTPRSVVFSQFQSADGDGLRMRRVVSSKQPESRAADPMTNVELNLKPKRFMNRDLVTKSALLILGGYVTTLISIVLLYRWQENAFLFSDAVPCVNKTQKTDPDAMACDYNLDLAVQDLFLPLDASEGSPVLHLWRIRSLHPTRTTDHVPLTVIFTHGNVDNIACYKPIYSWLSDLGVDVVAWDYPGYGKSSGFSNEPTITAAAASVMNHVVKNMEVPEQRVVLWGYSLGGSVVTQLVIQHPSVAGVILQSPIDSAAAVLRDALPLTGWAIPFLSTQPFDTESRMGSLQTCLFLFVGSEDGQFSVERETALYEKANHADPSCSSFVVVKGMKHLDDPTKNEDFRKLGEAFLGKIMLRALI